MVFLPAVWWHFPPPILRGSGEEESTFLWCGTTLGQEGGAGCCLVSLSNRREEKRKERKKGRREERREGRREEKREGRRKAG